MLCAEELSIPAIIFLIYSCWHPERMCSALAVAVVGTRGCKSDSLSTETVSHAIGSIGIGFLFCNSEKKRKEKLRRQ